MINKEFKQNIRGLINAELRKEQPNYRKIREWYVMIEDENKKIEQDGRRLRGKNKRAYPTGTSHHGYIKVDKTKEEYIALKLEGKTDREVAKLWGITFTKMARLRVEWGIKNKYKQYKISQDDYLRCRKNGMTLNQICYRYGLDRGSLYYLRKKWGLVSDMYNTGMRTKKEENK